MNAQKILIISAADPARFGSWPAGYETVHAVSDEAAIELAQQQSFNAIVIDDTDVALHPRKLQAILPILQPEVALFRFKGAQDASLPAVVHDHFRRERNARIRRYFVIGDDFNFGQELPAFSAN